MEYPIGVVAVSLHDGHVYAQSLGIENYQVFTDKRAAEGFRVRQVLVTSEYLAQVVQNYVDSLDLIRMMWINRDRSTPK